MSVFSRRQLYNPHKREGSMMENEVLSTDRWQITNPKERSQPLMTKDFRDEWDNTLEVEKDAKGHSVDQLRTTDPTDMVKVDRPEYNDEYLGHLTFKGGDNRCHIIRPFGPSISEFKIRDDILQLMREIVDYVYNNEYQDYTQHLAGVITEEGYIPARLWFSSGVGKYFEEAVAQYLIESIACSMMEGAHVPDPVVEAQNDSKPIVKTNSSWFNVMRENEYNPLHYHTNCHVSGVAFINVPEYEKRTEIKYGQDSMDGNLVMVNNNDNPQNNFCMGHTAKDPVVGMCYLFPSFMQHTVYPFRGKGERVSCAFNFSVEWADKIIDPLQRNKQ